MTLRRRLYQTLVHPQLFRQTVQLTDGSTVRLVTLSPSKSFVKAGVDALSHPSWDPRLRSRMMLGEDGEVSKFNERYEGMDAEVAALEGLMGTRKGISSKAGRIGSKDGRKPLKK